MGLTVAIGNALSGLKANQSALEIVSRNVSNAGTPGYHRQSLGVVEASGSSNTYVRVGDVTRAFDQTLQSYYTRQVADTAYANVRASYLDRLQTYIGKPGSAGSLDTMFGELQTALDKLATSPDGYGARAEVISGAQGMVQTLNRLTDSVQAMRQEAETKIASSVSELNDMLKALEQVNLDLADHGVDSTSRATLLDHRDRLVSGVSEMVDLRVDYRGDGTVALSTRSGTSLLDVKRSIFEFEAVGGIVATSEFNQDPSKNAVGKLTLLTPAGGRVDLVQQGVLQSGSIGGLLELRDKTLVDAQRQLDDIAAALAQAFSTVEKPGTPIAGGFSLDLGTLTPPMQSGNDLLIEYTDGGGIARTVKVVNAGTIVPLPANYQDANGTQVVHANLTDAAATAGVLNAALTASTGLSFANPAGDTLEVTNAAGNLTGVTARTTASSAQDGAGGLGVPLFVDAGGVGFTNGLDGYGQKRGFAGRISINPVIANNNALLVEYQAGGSGGDSKRVDYLVEQLKTMRFASEHRASPELGNFRLNGTLSDLISQTIDYQGGAAGSALSKSEMNTASLEALTQRMQGAYGVDVNEEIARLMELQNAYSANARVVSVVQELLDALMRI